jgi:hypothetical protein
MGGQVRQALLWTAVLFAGLNGRAAQATEWRYCVALSPAQRTLYMSPPFATDESMETIESEFGGVLDHGSIQHDAVQCPRGEAGSIAAMRQQSIQYSQASGDKVVQLNWKP